MLKKMMILTFIAVTMLLKVYAGQKHAVIITGDYRYNKEEYKERSYTFKWWNDTVALWYMLVKEQGYSPENVYVLFAGGEDYTTVIDEYTLSFIPAQYRLDVWEQYDEYGFNYDDPTKPFKHLAYSSASDENICDIFDSLATVMSDDDMLFVAAITHGGYVGIGDPEVEPNMDGIMLIWDDVYGTIPVITDYKFASLIEQVPANKKVFWLAQCHSGTFVDNLENMKDGSSKIINTSCQFDEVSRPADNFSWTDQNLQYGEGIEFEHLFEEYPDEFVIHDEFTFHMYTSTTGNRPFSYYDVRQKVAAHAEYYQRPSLTADYEWFPITEGDLNNDGIFSASESFIWLDKYESIDWADGQKSVFSDLEDVSESTSLLYPTIIFNSHPTYLSTIKGIMAIPLDINVSAEDLLLPANSNTTVLKNSIITVTYGYNFVIQQNATLKLLADTEITNEGKFAFNTGSNLVVEGSARITGSVQMADGMNIDILENSQLYLQGTVATLPETISIKIGKNAKLIIENGSDIVFSEGMNIELSEGAEIVVMNKGNLTAEGTTFSYVDGSGKWMGINCLYGSSVELNNVNIIGAETGVRGEVTYKFKVTNSTFNGCTNGIDLVGMQPGYDYIITDNTLSGVDDGRGISITSADGVFSRNIINHFNIGAYFIMSSPAVSKCEISYNKYHGIVISGSDALPQLINTEQMQAYGELNSVIEKNGYVSNTDIFPSAQIGIIPVGSIYMRNNDVISSINFPGISIAQKDVRDQHILIGAQYNYWGAEVVTDDYFFGHTDYTIDYEPYYSAPCGTGGINPTLMQSISTESRILTNALNLETKDKLTPAIKLYEHIIKKYFDTPEYYVAMARLPYLYEKAELDNDELIATYDEAIESENISHKKFFKGKKVATHIKGKRYYDAILVAEEMKAEAENEEEIILADINIAIANMLKNTEGKGRSETNSDDLRELISKLNGDTDKYNPSDITETVLPSEHELFQNYPNPFNPVTQIKFALAKAADVKLSVYNISGQLVSQLASGMKKAGVHTIEFDGSRFNSGVYYYTLEVEGKSLTQKMILMK